MRNVILLMIAALALSSCAKKEYLYLADMAEGTGYVVANRHQTCIQDDDRLKITVSCKNPELAAPFNVGSATVKVNNDGQVSTNARGYDNVYRVNSFGDINFPILGELHIAGKSLSEAADYIRNLIIAGNYIKDPIVSIEFMNFHYTVLGSVGGNGSYSVEGDKVTILEAIAKAGDLSNNADISNIAIIRESGGERRVYNVDIRSTDLFNSPAFYLAQNDIVYVRPRKPRTDGEGRAKVFQWLTIALSAVTASCSVVWAIQR